MKCLLGRRHHSSHVLYVPNLAVNLIYVSCLATDANCFVAFSHDICVLEDRTSKSPIGLGKTHRDVFVFQPFPTATMAIVSESESYELWHRRMGHPSSQPLIHLPTVLVVSSSFKTICDVCCRAKHTRTVFPDSTSRAMDIFGLIHCDIWGPYRGLCRTFYGIPSSDRGDIPPGTWGDPSPSPAPTPSPGLSVITTGPDPEISSPTSPPSSPSTTSPTLSHGKRQKKAHFVLKDYVCHTAQVLPPPASSTPTKSSSGPRYPLANFVSLTPQLVRKALHRPTFLWLSSVPCRSHTLHLSKRGVLSVLVYVDDLILAGNNSTACSSFKQYLNDCFKLKDLGPLKYFLGIEAACGPRGLFLSQRKYALDILSESSLSLSKPTAFPME
ncbi:hypothetical protein RJ640_003214 [Escallonia rubra]|uniref:Reverse transcriptase Ty1/copia-type domain-containing protein n=1 Tax=Escallonia rubra TaxID=112253 RepID=A0AA88RR35_9ASTE|nr:hypothetical protein RJ640_003214 [Escallonia rubra]